MQPTKIDNRQEDIFRGRLSNELNPKHEMMILSRLIPWDSLEVEFADLYQSNSGGQPPKPIRSQTVVLEVSLQSQSTLKQCWRSASKANPLDDWNSFTTALAQSF